MFGPESTATGRPVDERRQPLPVAGSRPFVRLSTGARPASDATTSPKTRLGTATTTSSASATGASSMDAASMPARSTSRQVARVPAGLADRLRLLRVAAGERDLVAARGEQDGERRPPRPRADDDDPHERRTKSIDDRDAFEAEPLAQLVLDPVAVVARDEARIVDEEAEARRPRAAPACRRAG